MNPSRRSFALELCKLAEEAEPEKPSFLRRILPAAVGLAAGAGAYKYLRKVKLSKNPGIAAIQRKAKGRLTHIDDAEVVPGRLGRIGQRIARGVDEVVSLPPSEWRPLQGVSMARLKKIKAKKIEGAMLPMGGPSQSAQFKADFNLNQNPTLSVRLEDKLREARVLARTPGGAPRSEAMSRHVRGLGAASSGSMDQLQARLARRYPKGYVVKPVNDAASGGVPTHRDRFATILSGKKTEHKSWMKDMMSNPERYMVQEHLDIASTRRMLSNPPRTGGSGKRGLAIGASVPDEWRVHVADGKVVPGASMHRWTFDAGLSPTARREISEVDTFMQANLDKMPRDVRGVPMAADVVRTKDGKLKIIELNPGGQSGFLDSPTLRGSGWNYYKGVTGRHSQAEAAVKGISAGAAATLAAGAAGGDKKKQVA